jgi:hypothetical protein
MKDLVTEFRALAKADDNALSPREKCRQIERLIEPLECFYREAFSISSIDLDAANQLLEREEDVRLWWESVSKPASADQIGVQIMKLTGSMPMANGIDRAAFAHTLAEDIEDARPTIFMLERTSRLIRRKERWLSIQSVLAGLASAKRKARHIDRLLKSGTMDSLRKKMLHWEKELSHRLEQQREAALVFARAKLERHEPVALFTQQDCEALGMTRREITEHYQIEREFESEWRELGYDENPNQPNLPRKLHS